MKSSALEQEEKINHDYGSQKSASKIWVKIWPADDGQLVSSLHAAVVPATKKMPIYKKLKKIHLASKTKLNRKKWEGEGTLVHAMLVVIIHLSCNDVVHFHKEEIKEEIY